MYQPNYDSNTVKKKNGGGGGGIGGLSTTSNNGLSDKGGLNPCQQKSTAAGKNGRDDLLEKSSLQTEFKSENGDQTIAGKGAQPPER